MAKQRIAKWGNSLALRLPVSFARQLELQEGSPVVVTIEGNVLHVRAKSEEEVPPLPRSELLKGLRMLKGARSREQRTRLVDEMGPPIGKEVR